MKKADEDRPLGLEFEFEVEPVKLPTSSSVNSFVKFDSQETRSVLAEPMNPFPRSRSHGGWDGFRSGEFDWSGEFWGL
jgi:hypothetical protein